MVCTDDSQSADSQEALDIARSAIADDQDGIQEYAALREAGRTHTSALWQAINNFRMRERGMDWDRYHRVMGHELARQAARRGG